MHVGGGVAARPDGRRPMKVRVSGRRQQLIERDISPRVMLVTPLRMDFLQAQYIGVERLQQWA